MSRELVAPDPELALVLALLRGRPDAGEIDRLAEAVGDWPRFLVLVRRHRVMSLATHRLSWTAVPADLRAQLRNDRHGRSRLGLWQIAEAARLISLLETGGVRCLLLKGAGLSVRAFGAPLLRDGRDIDLLIEPRSLARAEAILTAAGLRLDQPCGASPLGRAMFRRYSHEYPLTTPSGVTVELKTRLQPTPALLPITAAEALSRRVWLPVAGTRLPVPADADLLLYLCAHGARHCWFRLKWLADIAALLAEDEGDAAVRLLAGADRVGDDVVALEAMALAHDWLGSAVPDDVLARARANRLVQRRRPMVVQAILHPAPFEHPGFAWTRKRSEYLLRRETSYRLAVLERHIVTLVQAAPRWLLGGKAAR
jgi:hypothetical protein